MKQKTAKTENLGRRLHRLVRHLFWPHRGNAFRPHALRHPALTFYGVILILAQLFLGTSLFFGPSLTSAEAQNTSLNIITRVNSARSGQNLPALKENQALDTAAAKKLQDMFAQNYWDHTGPKGETAWSFIDASGYHYSMAGENLAKGFDDSDTVVTAWMASPEHRANILNTSFTDTGVAVASGQIDGQHTTLMVQLFGQPKVLVAGATSTNAGPAKILPELSLANATEQSKAPFVILWGFLFGLIILDGLMIRRLGLTNSKVHLYQFRMALLVMGVGVGMLCLGITAIA